MASFTDKLIEFNPFISQLPVDDYVSVGMAKQQQYDQGVAKVQNYIDNVRGLEVIKGEHRDYVDKTLQNLQGEVSKVVSADFSNSQLTSQIGNLTSRIVSDPIVQNAVLSTQKYKKALAEMEKARAEGKSSVENEWKFQQQADSWLSDGNTKSPFTGSYIPYRDVRKKIFETIKAIDPSSKLTQLPFKRNADGSTMIVNGRPEIDKVMLETSYEGKDVETIRNAIELALDETDINQLNIEGEYHFRNYDPVAMKQLVDKEYGQRIDDYNNRLIDLETKKLLKVNDNVYQASINNQINSVKESAGNLQKNYEKEIGALSTNPEAFKSIFYRENYFQQVANTFSSSKESFKYLESVFQKQANNERDFELNYQDKLHSWNMDKLNYEVKLKELSLKEQEAIGLTASGLLPTVVDLASPTEDAQAAQSIAWQEGIKAQEQNLETLKEAVLKNAWGKLPKEEAKIKLLEAKKAWEEGGEKADLAPMVADYFRTVESETQEINNKKQTIININNELNRNPDLRLGEKESIGLKMGATQYGTEELLSYDDKVRKVIKTKPTGGLNSNRLETTTDEKEAKKIMTSKELQLFQIQKKQLEKKPLTTGEKRVIEVLDKIGGISAQTRAIANKRERFISERLTPLVKEFTPEAYTVDVGKPAQLKATRGYVNNLLLDPEFREESVGKSPNFDFEETKKAMNNPETTFGVYKQGTESYITVAGEGKTQFVPISSGNLNALFPKAFNRPFDRVQRNIQLSGGVSTNVQGKGHETAFFKKGDFRNVKTYGVKADLEPIPTGGYQLKVYIHNPKTKIWEERIYGRAVTDSQALAMIDATGDQTIKELLEDKPEE